MYTVFEPDFYYSVCAIMLVLASFVFLFLYRFNAGYGILYTKGWGPTIDNRLGWILMESPIFIAMLLFWILSSRRTEPTLIVMASLFEIHYFQRSFIFPMLIRGKSRMPVAITLMGSVFNLLNSYMIGGWLFYVSPVDYYPVSWLRSPLFIFGTLVFITGMIINLNSDNIIRHLRRPGDTRHYIPRGGMFRYVTSANYFGEFTEWIGYALLTWSLGGLVFAAWTFANLAPRAMQLHKRYCREFGDEYRQLNRRYMIPYIY